MIRLRESLLLASTKLKTRRIRLFVTVLISSLLFAVLALVGGIVQGTIHSFKSFGTEGYGGRYLVQATPLNYQSAPDLPSDMKRDLLAQNKALVDQKKAAAKRLKIDYSEKEDQNLPFMQIQNGPSSFDLYPNYSHPLVTQALEKKNIDIPGSSFNDFVRVTQDYGAIATFRGATQNYMGMGMPGGASSLAPIINEREDLSKYQSDGARQGMPDFSGINSINDSGWRSIDSGLLKPFMLPGQSTSQGKEGDIPVVAPFSAAEEILQLKPLPKTATAEQKLERLKSLRQQIAGKILPLCYRNSESVRQLSDTLSQQKDIAANKNNKEYTKPSLIYGLPDAPCGPVRILSDKRSANEKRFAANQLEFDTQFGLREAPVEGIVKLRVIGVNSDVNMGMSLSIVDAISGMLSSTLGMGWVSPTDSVNRNVIAKTFQGGVGDEVARQRQTYYAEFRSLEDMKAFITSQECKGLETFSSPNGVESVVVDPGGSAIDACVKQSKVFTVGPYGNSAGAIEQFRQGIWRIFRYVLLVIVVLAALIMMGNIGKIIADSRRETAVFRALGAKRLDIAQIYVTYTVLLSLATACLGVIIGLGLAKLISGKYSPDLSVAAVLAYNAQDVEKQFSLFGINFTYIVGVVALAVCAGLLSAAFPLLANMRRNPIKDMRDDT